jgi:hypothetical protein
VRNGWLALNGHIAADDVGCGSVYVMRRCETPYTICMVQWLGALYRLNTWSLSRNEGTARYDAIVATTLGSCNGRFFCVLYSCAKLVGRFIYANVSVSFTNTVSSTAMLSSQRNSRGGEVPADLVLFSIIQIGNLAVGYQLTYIPVKNIFDKLVMSCLNMVAKY